MSTGMFTPGAERSGVISAANQPTHLQQFEINELLLPPMHWL